MTRFAVKVTILRQSEMLRLISVYVAFSGWMPFD